MSWELAPDLDPTTTTAATATAAPAPRDRRLQLRGLRYAAQRAALAPVQTIASQGVTGAGGSLPYADVIQASFGRHDVSGVSAFVGGPAASAAKGIGAEAYAMGSRVAFASAPTLHTAAHEAAHVVQQRAGVRPSGGVGKAGDEHERQADAVADRVVAGQSAEPILDTLAGSSGGGVAVQKKEPVPTLTPAEKAEHNASADAQIEAYQRARAAGMSEADAMKAAVRARDVRAQRQRVRAAWAKTVKDEAGMLELLRDVRTAAETRANTIAIDYADVMAEFGKYVAGRVSGKKKHIERGGRKTKLRATMAKIDTASAWQALSAHLCMVALEEIYDKVFEFAGPAAKIVKDALKPSLEAAMPKLKQEKYADFAATVSQATKTSLGQLRFGFFTHEVITPLKTIHATLARKEGLLTSAQEALVCRLGRVGSKASDRMLSGAFSIPTASQSKAQALRAYAAMIGKVEARNEELYLMSKASGPGERTEMRKQILRNKRQIRERTLGLGQAEAANLADRWRFKGPSAA